MRLLSSGDVCDITGLAPNTLDRWCADGIVTPAEGGEGTGVHRRFSPMQTLGLVVAQELRNGERGCAPVYIKKVVDAFARTNEKELAKRMAATKATRFVGVSSDGKVWLQDGPDYPEWPCVKAAYDHLLRSIAKLRQQERNPVGRNRALASK